MTSNPQPRDELAFVARCLARDPEALRILQSEYVQRTDRALASMRIDAAERDDIRQKLWIRLVLDDPPRLAQYSAKGSLHGFIRTVAVRLALDERDARSGRRETDESVLLGLPDTATGPEGALAKRLSRAQFRACFEAALARLTARERTILRQVYVDGLSSDAVGHLHGAHRASIFRWTVEARRKLAKELRSELASVLRIPVDDVPMLAAFVRSELSLSLARVLG